jgi:hypothetical protein
VVIAFLGGNNDQVCVVHCHRRLCPLSFIVEAAKKKPQVAAASSGPVQTSAPVQSYPKRGNRAWNPTGAGCKMSGLLTGVEAASVGGLFKFFSLMAGLRSFKE